MNDNPYTALHEGLRKMMGGQIPATLRLGTVISKEPLTIDVAGTLQTREDLLVNPDVIPVRGGTALLLPIDGEQRYIFVCMVV